MNPKPPSENASRYENTVDSDFTLTACDGDTRGTVVTWDLKPGARPAKELVRLAELFSLHHLDSSGTLVPLDLETLTNTSWRLNP